MPSQEVIMHLTSSKGTCPGCCSIAGWIWLIITQLGIQIHSFMDRSKSRCNILLLMISKDKEHRRINQTSTHALFTINNILYINEKELANSKYYNNTEHSVYKPQFEVYNYVRDLLKLSTILLLLIFITLVKISELLMKEEGLFQLTVLEVSCTRLSILIQCWWGWQHTAEEASHGEPGSRDTDAVFPFLLCILPLWHNDQITGFHTINVNQSFSKAPPSDNNFMKFHS